MQPVRLGDRVQVHYVKRLSDGSAATSRGRPPLELTAGSQHPRLPGIGKALLGLFPGDIVTVSVPPDYAYGPYDTGRVHCLARARFPQDQSLAAGKRVQVLDRRGRRRSVRILEVRETTVLVDSNHRFAGQTLEIKVKVIGIQAQAACPGTPVAEDQADSTAPPGRGPRENPFSGDRRSPADGRDQPRREDLWRDVGGEA